MALAQRLHENQSLEFAFDKCDKTLELCGHTCNGVSGESRCLPCFREDCDSRCRQEEAILEPQDVGKGPEQESKQEGDTRQLIGGEESLLCGLCHVQEMREMPLAALTCRHVFHASCIAKRLARQWHPAKRITFTFLNCPICRKEMAIDYTVPKLDVLLAAALAEKAEKMA